MALLLSSYSSHSISRDVFGSMGLGLAQIVSDETHFLPFVCQLCSKLCALDALVTVVCSHPFCRSCLEAHIAVSNECPSCQCCIVIDMDNDEEHMYDSRHTTLHSNAIKALPMQECQPLAYQVLSRVQVTCQQILTEDIEGRPCTGSCCGWRGDYARYTNHRHSAIQQNQMPSLNKVIPKSSTSSLTVHMSSRSNHNIISDSGGSKGNGRPDMKEFRSLSTPSVRSNDVSESTLDYTLSENGARSGDDSTTASRDDSTLDLLSPRTKFRRSASLRDVHGGAPVISLHDLKQYSPPKQDILTGRTPVLETPTGLPPAPASSYRDTPPAMVHRTISGDGMQKTPPTRPSSVPIVDEPLSQEKSKPAVGSSATSALTSPKKSKRPSINNDSDLEVSYSHALDWNMSINNFGSTNNANNNSIPSLGADNSLRQPLDTLNEDEEKTDFQLVFEPETNEEPTTRKVFDKAERYKKQANAKFNKGDFSTARALYSAGIAVMESMAVVSQDERELLSGMHSNRGVTFFREKDFPCCIEDCEKAITYDPTYDKSWIRRWRAHMALGDFDGAHQCLVTANRLIPDSKKIQEELMNSKADKDLLAIARQSLAKKDYEQIREVLRPHALASENITLLFLAAKADAYLGHTESALEKINKALRFNPMHAEGLELRGHTLFLAGDTEKGAHLLQEALNINKDNKLISKELSRCQKTHTSFQKGRACVKRGRYAEAVDHFTQAMKDSGTLPSKTPLFSALRVERAEAYLFCNKYVDACKDCQEVITSQPEHATAWSVRGDILLALGEAEQARRELKTIKKTWGFDNPTIGEAYKRIDFELRVQKADKELGTFLVALESGQASSRFELEEVEKRAAHKSPQRKNNRSSGSIEFEADLDPKSRDGVKRRNKPRHSVSRHRSRSRGFESDNGSPGEREQSRIAREPPKRERSNFIPPPSIEDMTNDDEKPSAERRVSNGTNLNPARGLKREVTRKRN
jgi:tetratricopeptide (TPR) repeat protein